MLEAKMIRKPDKLILLGSAHAAAIKQHVRITDGSTFIYQREKTLLNVLLESFAEADFIARQYESTHSLVIANGTPELPDYIRELNEAQIPEGTIIEVHVIELSTYFKSFILLVKVVLDKLVPLYSYQFHDGLRQFEDKGSKLIACIRRSKTVGNRDQLIQMISRAKQQWIDQLISLRDGYAHYSELPEYRNFWLSADVGSRELLRGIADFSQPIVTH
jgi:hypothetical protein